MWDMQILIGVLLAILVATALSAALGSTAMVEKAQMMLGFSSAAARVILMLGLIIFVCFHIRQAFDQKEIDVLLSRPLSRFQVMLAYWLGFSFVAFLLVLATVTLFSFLPIFNFSGYIYWSLSLLAESFVVVALGLFAAFTLRSAVLSVIATLGFYTLARMAGFFIATADGGMMTQIIWLNQLMEWTVKITALIIPRLDLFTQSEWLIYGVTAPQELSFAAVQLLVYIPLLLTAATIDFMRKQF